MLSGKGPFSTLLSGLNEGKLLFFLKGMFAYRDLLVIKTRQVSIGSKVKMTKRDDTV